MHGIVLGVALALLACPWATGERRGPLSKSVLHHETLTLDAGVIRAQHGRRRSLGPQDEFALDFTAYGQRFELRLRHAKGFIHADFKMEFRSEAGVDVVHGFDDVGVFYYGHSAAHPTSAVQASIVDGHFKAAIDMPDGERFFVDPAHHHPQADLGNGSRARHSHVVYPASAAVHVNGTCGVDHAFLGEGRGRERGGAAGPLHGSRQDATEKYFGKTSFDFEGLAQERARQRRNGVNGDPSKFTCVIELFADQRYYQQVGLSSRTTTVQTMLSILAKTNAIFLSTTFEDGIGAVIQIAVGSVVVYESADTPGNPFQAASTTANNFLNQLTGKGTNSFCLSHAFTYQDFDANVLGLAYLGQLCQSPPASYSEGNAGNTGITTALSNGSPVPQAQLELVNTHELGHNFFMSHDSDCNDYCQANPDDCTGNEYDKNPASGKYIMNPIAVDGSNSNNRLFSGCSIASASDHINTAGTCFTAEGQEVCGNGIVTSNEICDCGSTDPGECATNDACCDTDCTLATGAECSTFKGVCCEDDCSVTLSGEGKVCAAASECYTEIMCDGNVSLAGACPSRDTQDANGTYLFHRPYGTLCNGGANICNENGCEGSRCELFEATQVSGEIPSEAFKATNSYKPVVCFDSSTDGSEACHVACKFEENGPCVSTFAYAATPHGLSMAGFAGLERAAGKSCMGATGYCERQCEGSGDSEVCAITCTAASGNNALDSFLNSDILGWVAAYWYIVLSVEAGVLLLVFLNRCWARRKGGRVTVRAAQKRPSALFTLRRPQHHIVRQATQKRAGIVVELDDQTSKESYPDEALARVQVLFPTCPVVIASRVIKASPHEESAVHKLLVLGYPMRMLEDYVELKKAGRNAYRRKKATSMGMRRLSVKAQQGMPQPKKMAAPPRMQRGGPAPGQGGGPASGQGGGGARTKQITFQVS